MFNKPHVPSTPSRRFLDPRQCTEHTRSGLSPREHKCSELRETIQPKNVDKRAQAKRTQCRRRPGDATRQEKVFRDNRSKPTQLRPRLLGRGRYFFATTGDFPIGWHE